MKTIITNFSLQKFNKRLTNPSACQTLVKTLIKRNNVPKSEIIRKRLRHRLFSLNFAKLLRALLSQKIAGQLLLEKEKTTAKNYNKQYIHINVWKTFLSILY